MSSPTARDEQSKLMGGRSMSSKTLNSQDLDVSIIRCCQTFAGVAALLVMAFMLLKGCNSMMLSKPEAAEAEKPRSFLPAPSIERPHGRIEVVQEVDDGYDWVWRGSKRYAMGDASEQCYYDYDGKTNADCFCQLAQNKACRQKHVCHCSQGCSSNLTWRHERSATFKNFKYATGCEEQSPVALLTVPESHFQDIRSLKTWCPKGAQSLLAEMLKTSFQTYRAVVDQGPVRQCVHAAQLVSVSWLHLHTLCSDGTIDGLPGSPHVGWCSIMHSSRDAEPLAASVMLWAERLYGVRTDSLPNSCSAMGCGIRGVAGRCSCHRDCHQSDSCCGDFSLVCPK